MQMLFLSLLTMFHPIRVYIFLLAIFIDLFIK
jgi:hypothetical protein